MEEDEEECNAKELQRLREEEERRLAKLLPISRKRQQSSDEDARANLPVSNDATPAEKDTPKVEPLAATECTEPQHLLSAPPPRCELQNTAEACNPDTPKQNDGQKLTTMRTKLHKARELFKELQEEQEVLEVEHTSRVACFDNRIQRNKEKTKALRQELDALKAKFKTQEAKCREQSVENARQLKESQEEVANLQIQVTKASIAHEADHNLLRNALVRQRKSSKHLNEGTGNMKVADNAILDADNLYKPPSPDKAHETVHTIA